MGLPNIEGTMTYQLGGSGSTSGMIATMNYELFNNDVVFYSEAEAVVSLEVLGVDGTLIFENGGLRRFRVGTPQTIVVPAGGDVDHDGNVDVSISFTLDAQFTNEFAHAERAGYALSGGLAQVRVVSLAGDVLTNRRVGPAFEQLCSQRVGGTEIPITCLTSGETTTTSYSPGGFSQPYIVGAIDLVAP